LVILGTLVSSLAGCVETDEPAVSSREEELSLKPWSTIAILAPSSDVKQTTAQGWSLAKTGRVDTSAQTVTWDIAATSTSSGQKTLVVTGKVTLWNIGTAPATIGNIVVNLDAKNPTGNSFTTVASNVADAAHGDAATSVKIVGMSDPDADQDDDNNPFVDVRTVTENGGSGTLTFTKGASTPWAISPKQQIPAFGSLDLRFTATFNNTALTLATGRVVRPQLLITQGNAGVGVRTIANVDIDGSGSISADEAARVRTKARNLGQKAVPAATNVASGAVAITDSAADITTTGTVSFSNPTFAFSGLNGTASVTYAGGTAGGTITNCAHLTGGATATACNTQAIPRAIHQWQDNEIITYAQTSWGATPAPGNAAQLLTDNFESVYGGFGVEVGVVGVAGFSMAFSLATDVLAYQPSSGVPGALTEDRLNPITTPSGEFGGEVLALELNVTFADANRLGLFGIGNQYVCALGNANLDGLTVRQVLALANNALGGVATSVSLDVLDGLLHDVNGAFESGAVTQYARDHIFMDGCP
jgi:hypothetical protein